MAERGLRQAAGTAAAADARPWWRAWHVWLLAALAAQYALVQLATGAQYFDGPRNLHWGVYILEEPRFLLDRSDSYNWINGFTPDPPELAPRGVAGPQTGALHPWWGPLYLLIFAGVWGLTGSYTLLQLVVPLAAGGTVLLTYGLGARLFGRGAGLLAAALLALFPVYRDYAPVSFVEPISALLITGALWAVLARRDWLAAGLGTLAMYGKIDLIFLYLGTVALTAAVWRLEERRELTVRRLALLLGLPALALLPWLLTVYVWVGRPVSVSGGGPSAGLFVVLAPEMLDQLFTLPRALGALTLTALLGAAGWALRRPEPAVRLLAVWAALGAVVLLVYAATPGASNNPRVVTPALPAVCLLAAAGAQRMSPRLRVYVPAYLLGMFVAVACVGTLYQYLQASGPRAALPAWELLRGEERGVVLTEHPWHAILFARQPAAWFEHDRAFQRNILHDEANFRRYLAANPIRYVVLPRDQGAAAARPETAAARLYRALPLGRDLGWDREPLVAPGVRAYLEGTFRRVDAGEYVVYVVR